MNSYTCAACYADNSDDRHPTTCGTCKAPFRQAMPEAIALRAEVDRLEAAWEVDMLRLKACEHIAEGDDGHENIADDCPSIVAVRALKTERDKLAEEGCVYHQLVADAAGILEQLPDERQLIVEVAKIRNERDKLREILREAVGHAEHNEALREYNVFHSEECDASFAADDGVDAVALCDCWLAKARAALGGNDD